MKKPILSIGDEAPQFDTVDTFRTPVALQDFKDSFVLLVFLRYAGCPFCNLTIHRLTTEYPMLADNGCKVIAFVQSDAERIRRDVYGRHKHRPQYPIVPDPGKRIYDAYGVQRHVTAKGIAKNMLDVPYWLKSSFELGFRQTKIDGDNLLVPATFLVGPDEQKIVRVEYGSSFYDHQTFTGIYEPLVFK